MGSKGFIVGLEKRALPKVIARQGWAPKKAERYLIWEVSLVFFSGAPWGNPHDITDVSIDTSPAFIKGV
jgi:hypothetical protein